MLLVDGVVLYHGSYVAVETPDLRKCRPHKDFGRGFYVTASHEQAVRFTRTATMKAIRRRELPANTHTGYVSSFVFHFLDSLKIHEFPNADVDWLHCVVAHRRQGQFPQKAEKWHNFDIIAGKIANDNTNMVITVFMSGGYGAVESSKACETALGFLLPERLKNQACFRTEYALSALAFAGSEKISWQS